MLRAVLRVNWNSQDQQDYDFNEWLCIAVTTNSAVHCHVCRHAGTMQLCSGPAAVPKAEH